MKLFPQATAFSPFVKGFWARRQTVSGRACVAVLAAPRRPVGGAFRKARIGGFQSGMRTKFSEHQADAVDTVGRRRIPAHCRKRVELDQLDRLTHPETFEGRMPGRQRVTQDVSAVGRMLDRFLVADEV